MTSTHVSFGEPEVFRYSRREIDAEMAELEREHGDYAELERKAVDETLTAAERAAFRRIQALRFIRSVP